MKEKTREALKSALFEATFVALGVVLALGANQWQEVRKNREEAALALAGIVEELRTNRAAVEESLLYHEGLMRAMRETAPPDVRLFSRGFVSPARVYRTAWDSASTVGALSHLELATIQRLSRAYAHQDQYDRQAQSVASILYTELFRGGTQAVLTQHLSHLINTFVYREKQLLQLYDETLAFLAEKDSDSLHAESFTR